MHDLFLYIANNPVQCLITFGVLALLIYGFTSRASGRGGKGSSGGGGTGSSNPS